MNRVRIHHQVDMWTTASCSLVRDAAHANCKTANGETIRNSTPTGRPDKRQSSDRIRIRILFASCLQLEPVQRLTYSCLCLPPLERICGLRNGAIMVIALSGRPALTRWAKGVVIIRPDLDCSLPLQP